jgi:uncharacterized membrane protein YeaQ/YmgE (transglycosylase-associated protein family)
MRRTAIKTRNWGAKNMCWFWPVLLGAVVGVIARLTHPAKENMGWFITIVIGIAGSVLAALSGDFTGWYGIPSWIGFFVGMALALILVAIYARVRSRRWQFCAC